MLKTRAPSYLVSRHLSFARTYIFPNHSPQQIISGNLLLSLLKKCKSNKQLHQIHAQMLVNCIPIHNFLLPKVIDHKDFNYASLVFSQISEPNDFTFNIMIRGLTTTWHDYPLTLQFYYQMKFLGVKPNNFTYPFLFIACANLLEVNHGQAAHSSVFKFGLDSDSHTTHSLITMYARCGKLCYARKVFDEITDRDLVSWNSMISGYSQKGYAGKAVELFGKMKDAGFEPDEMTLVSVLGACGELGDLDLGRWVEEFVVENKMELNSYVGSSLIGMYAKCGDLLSARRIFDTMVKKDNVTWNAMITGYAQNGMANEAIGLFNVMREGSLNPDKITLSGVLSACAAIGALDLGKWVDKYASQRGLQHNVYVATALIDMYAKCGSLDDALRVFEDMPQKNEVSWNAMISALASHGRAKEAISLFKRMSEEGAGARPDDITFVGVLSACVHVGLVDEGLKLFDMMSMSFQLVPKIEHYSCMVDLLARAGHLYEAWDFIRKMPEKPDGVVLGALLGACRKQRNVDLSEQVMQLLLDLEPSNSWNYVMSSKIFANSNRLEDSARMRVLMRQKGVTKTPGCSWIEIENQLHEFHAGDDLLNHLLYLVLDFLFEELKREGYVPKVDE
ncbi:Pentatricopeptide repeat-containing protein [Quillaja saponaria]|uniref:Pentatricopeptide repeat-containing protein n=1 Tax=Quillaja saponaria TaxID=32244 RepID=A0AAD7QDP7_QUISA|nr:Pentatricopeptide repeat-containing protein [Quillaja saponaria]